MLNVLSIHNKDHKHNLPLIFYLVPSKDYIIPWVWLDWLVAVTQKKKNQDTKYILNKGFKAKKKNWFTKSLTLI